MQQIYVIRCILSFFLLLPLHALADNQGEKLLDEADSLYALQQYDAAGEAAQNALSRCKDGELEADCLNLLAIIHVRKGEFDKAVTYAKQCYALDEKSGDPDATQEAEKYVLKAIDFAQKANNPQRLAVLHGMASEVYHHLKQEERSLDYATKAYEMERELGREDKMAIRQAERASALVSLKRDAEARKALDEAIPGLRKSANIHSLGIACNQMGLLMHQEKNDSAAVRYFNEALQIFLSQHDLFNESHSRKGLYEALRHTDPDLAMEHNDRYNALRDSIYDKDTGELLSKYAVEYGYNELQAENEGMRSDRRLSYIIGVVVVLLMLAVLAYGFWRYRRARRRIQELIAEISKLREGAVSPVEVAAEPEGEEPVKEEQPDPDRQFLLHLIDVVNANLPSGRYGVEDIASEMNMGVQTFRRRLLSVTGESPKAFISAIQMELAAKLLTDSPDMSVTQIANRCGYDEVTSFGRTFRKTYGISPSQYRENH